MIAIPVVTFLFGLFLALSLRATGEGGATRAALVGFVLAAFGALVVGLAVPNTYPVSTDGTEALFTDRVVAEIVVIFSLALWLVGAGVGAALSALNSFIGRRAESRRRSVDA